MTDKTVEFEVQDDSLRVSVDESMRIRKQLEDAGAKVGCVILRSGGPATVRVSGITEEEARAAIQREPDGPDCTLDDGKPAVIADE